MAPEVTVALDALPNVRHFERVLAQDLQEWLRNFRSDAQVEARPMLIRFAVANHRSIRDRQELSLVASPLKGGASQVLDVPGLKERLLPAALIYGANASGKSNVLHALAEMRRHVVESFRKNEPEGKIARAPFALRERTDAPTTFEVDLLLDGVRYAYGFDVTDRAFTREWLHAWPHGHRQAWFERDGSEPMRFGKGLKGANKAIEDFLRPNALYLSTAAQHGHRALVPLFRSFSETMSFSLSPEVSAWEAEQALIGNHGEAVLDLVRANDLGISALKIEEDALENREALIGFVRDYGESFDIRDLVSSGSVKFVHLGRLGRTFEIEISDESRGTLRMSILAAGALHRLANGGLLVVDEIDASLHTDLVLRIVSLFTDPNINTKGAQLIATTHDTNLLSSDILRRDQVWFTEKDREGATTLYPLTDFRTRREDNIERGYRDGRFGAVPYLAPLDAFARRQEEPADG